VRARARALRRDGAARRAAAPLFAPPPFCPPPSLLAQASGDENGLLALALVQSLRDVGTTVPTILIMLMRGGVGSADCVNPEWKAARGRTEVRCHSGDTIAPEIVSESILAEFERLGAVVEVHDPIPTTPFTEGIPGGTQSFWGMVRGARAGRRPPARRRRAVRLTAPHSPPRVAGAQQAEGVQPDAIPQSDLDGL
jgi:hypothetical protein